MKRVYYMSMEFLMGRSLLNALYNLQISGQYSQVGTFSPATAHRYLLLPVRGRPPTWSQQQDTWS